MRSRLFHPKLLWGWFAACCLSVSLALAQNDPPGTAQASSLNEFRAAANAGLTGGSSKPIFSLGLVGLALLVIWGVVAAAPHARACYRLWRGDDEGAVQVYEKILQQHPQRTKFYTPLAELYLLLGRNDAHAIKVYKAILRLNLATSNRQEIKERVVQYYLKADQINDDDAIPVLEEALKAVYSTGPQHLPLRKRAAIQLNPRYV